MSTPNNIINPSSKLCIWRDIHGLQVTDPNISKLIILEHICGSRLMSSHCFLDPSNLCILLNIRIHCLEIHSAIEDRCYCIPLLFSVYLICFFSLRSRTVSQGQMSGDPTDLFCTSEIPLIPNMSSWQRQRASVYQNWIKWETKHGCSEMLLII